MRWRSGTIELLNYDLMAANTLFAKLPGDKDPLAHWAGVHCYMYAQMR